MTYTFSFVEWFLYIIIPLMLINLFFILKIEKYLNDKNIKRRYRKCQEE